MRSTRFLTLLAWAAFARPSAAQSPPSHRPINPLAASRTVAAYEPVTAYAISGIRVDMTAEYGNAIDLSSSDSSRYLLDAELAGLTVRVRRELSPALWVAGEAGVSGTYAGFADGFFEWYHGLIHYSQPERAARPRNTYGFDVALPDGATFSPPRRDVALDDVRLIAGWRPGLDQQSTLTLTLPTATAAAVGAGVPRLGLAHAIRSRALAPVLWEISVGGGVVPRHGPLSAYQHTLSAYGTSGVSIRLFGGHAIYGFFFYHTPYYHGTGLASLDNHELTGDFGWQMTTRGGRTWRIGFTEDLAPRDLGIDLVVKVSSSW